MSIDNRVGAKRVGELYTVLARGYGKDARAHSILVKNKKEPWGQTVTRFISPEGLLVGITFTPALRP